MGTRLAWQRNIGSYTKKSLQFWWSKIWILIVWETSDKIKAIVYMISLIYICLDFY